MQIQARIPLVELGDGLSDGQSSPHRPLGVVLVGDWSAEQRHYCVADEFLHRAAEPLQLGSEPLIVGGEQPSDVLDVQPLGAAGEADQVAEQHADPLALLPPGGGWGGQGSRAGQAEPGPRWVIFTAALTDRHELHRRWRSGWCRCALLTKTAAILSAPAFSLFAAHRHRPADSLYRFALKPPSDASPYAGWQPLRRSTW